MNRPSYLLLIVLMFFAALVALPILPSGGLAGDGSSGKETVPPEPVVLRMAGRPPKGTVELTGKVIDVVGWPLVGAQVSVDDTMATAPAAAMPTAPANTDGDGRFTLRVAENESVPLTVKARGGMQGHAVGVLPAENGADSVVVVAELPLPRSRVRAGDPGSASGNLAGEGLVEDEDGEPVSGAVVTVVETGVSVRAGEHGRYRIPLPVPSGSVGASFQLIARDHAGRVVQAKVEHTRQRDGLRPLPTLRLSPGHRVTGFVKDGAGNPAVGAGLVLSGQGQVRRVVTGGDGEFGIRGLLTGEYQLSALPHKGWVGFRHQLLVEGANRDVELQLRPERPLTILVQDQAGEPQSGVHLLVHEAGYCSAHGRSDARGRVILRGLGDGQLTFTVYEGAGQELEILRYDADEQRLVVCRGTREGGR